MTPERDDPSHEEGSFGSDSSQTVKAIVLVAIVVIVGFVVLKNIGGGSKTIKTTSPTKSVPVSSSATPTVTTSPTTIPPNPANVKVLVLNGTSTSGAATYFSNKLHTAGYNTLSAGDATSRTVSTTMIYVNTPGSPGTAVAATLGVGTTDVVSSVPPSAPVSSTLIKQDNPNVVVVIGRDISSQATSGGSTSSTTAAGAQSSTTG